MEFIITSNIAILIVSLIDFDGDTENDEDDDHNTNEHAEPHIVYMNVVITERYTLRIIASLIVVL